MTKVLVFTPTVNRGGMHLVVETLLGAFDRYADPDEWQFGVLGQRYDEIHQPIHYPDGWDVTQLDPVSKLPPYDFAYLATLADTFSAHLRRVVRKGKYDLVYCPTPWWALNADKWSLPVPLVIGVADFACDHMPMGPIAERFRAIIPHMVERADLTVFSSAFQQAHGERVYGFAPTRCIPYSADFVADGFDASVDAARRARATYGLPDEYVLAFHCFGHKGADTIIQAQTMARMQNAAVPPLVLAGIETEHYLDPRSKDQHVLRIRALLKRVGATLGVDTFILGHVPDRDIGGLHAGATCAVQASRSEGDISGASNAALLAGTPLIHSRLPAYDRLGANGEHALSFPVDNVAALARAIVACCTRRDQARERAERARVWAGGRTKRDVALEYLDAFRQALGGAEA